MPENQINNTLKGCPFCGSGNVGVDSVEDGGGWAVVCYECDATGPKTCSMGLDKEAAAKITNGWNRRNG